MTCCILCAEPAAPIPTATAPYAVCRACGLVRRVGRPSRLTPASAEPGDSWARASAALRLAALRPGMQVLVVDGGPGFCATLEDLARVRATDYPPSAGALASFDALLVFDRLERVGQPAALLEHALRWVRPGGRVLVSSRNLERPHGVLGDELLDGTRAHVFDEVTLRGLLALAGVHVERVDAEETLFAAGAFEPGPVAVAPRGRRGARVAACLDGYRHLERLRRALFTGADPAAQLSGLRAILARPTFDAHAARVVRELERALVNAGAAHFALALCDAVLHGEAAPALREHCRRSASLYRARLGMTRAAALDPAA